MNKDIIKSIFPEMVALVEKGLCPFCGKKVELEDFKDALSVKEFKISGLCVYCQDDMFK